MSRKDGRERRECDNRIELFFFLFFHLFPVEKTGDDNLNGQGDVPLGEPKPHEVGRLIGLDF